MNAAALETASPAEISPAIAKLYELELDAEARLGAALQVSRRLEAARNRRVAIERDKRELEQHRTANLAVREHTQRRIAGLVVRLAYADHEIGLAAARHERLNAEASSARATAETLAEHLRAELAALRYR